MGGHTEEVAVAEPHCFSFSGRRSVGDVVSAYAGGTNDAVERHFGYRSRITSAHLFDMGRQCLAAVAAGFDQRRLRGAGTDVYPCGQNGSAHVVPPAPRVANNAAPSAPV